MLNRRGWRPNRKAGERLRMLSVTTFPRRRTPLRWSSYRSWLADFSFYQRYRGYLLPVNSNIRHRIACKFSVERFHTSACDYNRADAPV